MLFVPDFGDSNVNDRSRSMCIVAASPTEAELVSGPPDVTENNGHSKGEGQNIQQVSEPP